MFKTANVGSTDRIVRTVAGVGLIILPTVMGAAPALRWGLPIVGLILVATAAVRFCPIFRVFGINTCKIS